MAPIRPWILDSGYTITSRPLRGRSARIRTIHSVALSITKRRTNPYSSLHSFSTIISPDSNASCLRYVTK
jgi:hypothetical protein